MENTILHESGAHRAVEIHGLVHDNLTKKNRIFNPLLLSIRIHMFLGLQDPDPDPLVRGFIWMIIGMNTEMIIETADNKVTGKEVIKTMRGKVW